MSSVPTEKCSSEELSIQAELYGWLASWHSLIGDLPSQRETLSQNIGLRVSEEWQLRLSSSLFTNWRLYSPVLTYIYTHMNTYTHTRPVCCLWFQLFYQAPFNKKLAPYWGSLLLDSQVGIDSHLTGALVVQMPWSFLRCAWTWLLWILFCTVSFISICFHPTLFYGFSLSFTLLLFIWPECQSWDSFPLYEASFHEWSQQNDRCEFVDKCQIYTPYLSCFSKFQNHLFAEGTTSTALLPMM